MEREGILFVISGFSGSGKGTVISRVLKQCPELMFSVSVTSRAPRESEVEGKDYFFVSKEKFKAMLDNGEFLESTYAYDNYYGTPKALIEEKINNGVDILLELDVIGSANLKKMYPNIVSIFLTAPSLADVKRRLVDRGSETPESIEKRIARYKSELEYIGFYDYCVINDRIDECVQDILAIMRAESCKVMRNTNIKNKLLEEPKDDD